MTTRRQFVGTMPAFALLGAAGRLIFAAAPARAQDAALSPDPFDADTVERRAIEAMIWGMPAVNLDLMYQAMLRETPARANQMLYWSALLDWKNQTLTPNTDMVYLTPYFDTSEAGPMVLEIPPADDGVINGTIMDAWQMPLEDVGPAGVDAGKGGKYLILPPDHAEAVPEGYIVLPSLTWKGYALLRSILNSGSDADLAKAVEYGKRIKALSPLPGRQSARDHLRRRRRRPLRSDHPLRRPLLRIARPRGADRALAAARPRDDRLPEDHRHREGPSPSRPRPR